METYELIAQSKATMARLKETVKKFIAAYEAVIAHISRLETENAQLQQRIDDLK